MKTTMFILIALLGLSTAAQAEPRAFAQRDQIKHLAHDLAEAAHYVHENAEGYSHHDNYREARALEALHQLDRQARRFNRKVRRNYRRPHRTEHAYRDLMRTYREAQRRAAARAERTLGFMASDRLVCSPGRCCFDFVS